VADFPEPALRPRLPDVVSEVRPAQQGRLDWVGMDRIALPLTLPGADGTALGTSAKVSAYVNLVDPDARGIHMSRLYRALDGELALRTPDATRLRALLDQFLDSHVGISDRARVRLRFDWPMQREALRSGLRGWRAYPVEYLATLGPDGFALESAVQVEYSSTCPGSAALARQLIQQQFERDFAQHAPAYDGVHAWLGSEQGICATPHAQRSRADVRVRFAPDAIPDAVALIDRVEAALSTPVQGAVRREDEQEFARLNGANPMYCEDAVRRIRAALERSPEIVDYAIRAAHLESLHPHDAVAVAVRGVPAGFVARVD
jgi:GTP cyclohydrolase I